MPSINIRQLILDALPGTVNQIAEKIDCTEHAVRSNLRIMGLEGVAHVSAKRGMPGAEFGPVWSAGPAGPDAPQQPDFGDRRSVPRGRPPAPLSTKNEDATIEQARARPATWCSGLD